MNGKPYDIWTWTYFVQKCQGFHAFIIRHINIHIYILYIYCGLKVMNVNFLNIHKYEIIIYYSIHGLQCNQIAVHIVPRKILCALKLLYIFLNVALVRKSITYMKRIEFIDFPSFDAQSFVWVSFKLNIECGDGWWRKAEGSKLDPSVCFSIKHYWIFCGFHWEKAEMCGCVLSVQPKVVIPLGKQV